MKIFDVDNVDVLHTVIGEDDDGTIENIHGCWPDQTKCLSVDNMMGKNSWLALPRNTKITRKPFSR